MPQSESHARIHREVVPCDKKIQMDDSKLLHVIFNMLKASTAFGSFKAMMSHGTIHNNDFERNRAFAALLRHCLELLQHCSILLL